MLDVPPAVQDAARMLLMVAEVGYKSDFKNLFYVFTVACLLLKELFRQGVSFSSPYVSHLLAAVCRHSFSPPPP